MPALLEARLDSAEVNGTKAKASSSESFSTLAEALDGRPVKLRHLRVSPSCFSLPSSLFTLANPACSFHDADSPRLASKSATSSHAQHKR